MASGYSHLRQSARYQSTTLVANWFEERELRRSTLKDLLSKKSTGTLRTDAYHERMGVALQEVELTKAQDDEYVHFGDTLQLVHVETSSVLACDVSEVDARPGEHACAATAAPQVTAPCARNALILTRYVPPPTSPAEPDYGDDTLRYGQKVQLAVHPYASGQEVDSEGGPRPLRLFSKPVSTTHFSKYCRNQLVGFTYRNSYDTVWEVVTPDPEQRALSVGLEVLAGAPILLMHCATQKPLLVENQKYPNDFGLELELSARTATNNGLKLTCEKATKGLLRGVATKTDSSDAHWAFINGTKVTRLPPPRFGEQGAAQCEAVRQIVADLIAKHGGVFPLERKLVTWASSRMQLPADETLLLLRQVGLSSDAAAAELNATFSIPAKPGYVDASSLLYAIRAEAAQTGVALKA